jgi:hypothetical protein
MHQILHYSALAGAGWISSNVVFVIGWCWMHSNNRHWMSEDGTKSSIFKLHNSSGNPGTVSPQHLSGSVTLLGSADMPVNRAS